MAYYKNIRIALTQLRLPITSVAASIPISG